MITLTLRFRVLSFLTIGGSTTFNLTDNPLHPMVVPPSSIKGTLRTAINNFLPKGYTSCKGTSPEEINEAHEKGGVCDVCKLFGYPNHESDCIKIEVVGAEKLERLIITRVSINDKTQTAERGKLFSSEAVKPLSEFEVRIHFNEECGDRLFKLLLYSLLALRLWRLGRNAMVDLKLVSELKPKDDEMKVIIDRLSSYLWGEGNGLLA